MRSESPEMIEQRLAESRRSLTAKVSNLEQKVSDTVHETTSAVRGTMDSVRGTMESVQSGVTNTFASLNGGLDQTIRSAMGSTSDAIDVRPHIRENPWSFVGGAFAAGLVTGLLVTRKSEPSHGMTHAMSGRSAHSAPQTFGGTVAPPSWIDGILDQIGGELKRVCGDVMSLAAEEAKKTVSKSVPEMMQGLVSRIAPQAGQSERDYNSPLSPKR